ncbi:MAG: PIG-L deacetylase family protein [Armatimonadota bacterium]|nr:PIG-L deacetylase family protein [Armatimonadota bacterium]
MHGPPAPAPTRLLVISPHGDDEVIGCGGLIARTLAEEGEVGILYMSFYGSQAREAEEACRRLGVSWRRALFPDWALRLDRLPQAKLIGRLEEEIAAFDPTQVFLPYPSHHQDHRAVYQATLAALRPGRAGRVQLMACYEYVYGGWLGHVDGGPGFLYVNIAPYWQAKRWALEAYADQLRPAPDPLSIASVEALARARGAEVGWEAAERFHVVRMAKA